MNINKPVRQVRHSQLERYSDESELKVHCLEPGCGGLLLVRRDQKTFQISRFDNCVLCGQRYEYLDDAIGGEPLGPKGGT